MWDVSTVYFTSECLRIDTPFRTLVSHLRPTQEPSVLQVFYVSLLLRDPLLSSITVALVSFFVKHNFNNKNKNSIQN